MAGLYETGRGVPADPLRACALYLRAAGRHDEPFGQEAFALYAAFSRRGLEFDRECQLLGNIGFDHGFEPVTFDLGPGHSIEWTLTAATVTHDGRTSRKEMMFGERGARFLPLQHTELATGPTRSLVRHFIEVFVWYPSGPSGPWTLRWHLFEVVRDSDHHASTPRSRSPPPKEMRPPRATRSMCASTRYCASTTRDIPNGP